MSDEKLVCVHCERDAEAAPLLQFEYQGETYGICFEHLPMMIHRPGMLAGKLPNAGAWLGKGGGGVEE